MSCCINAGCESGAETRRRDAFNLIALEEVEIRVYTASDYDDGSCDDQ